MTHRTNTGTMFDPLRFMAICMLGLIFAAAMPAMASSNTNAAPAPTLPVSDDLGEFNDDGPAAANMGSDANMHVFDILDPGLYFYRDNIRGSASASKEVAPSANSWVVVNASDYFGVNHSPADDANLVLMHGAGDHLRRATMGGGELYIMSGSREPKLDFGFGGNLWSPQSGVSDSQQMRHVGWRTDNNFWNWNGDAVSDQNRMSYFNACSSAGATTT